jgi:sugar transferase (PEP-CTERM/EpsH1 system associated)
MRRLILTYWMPYPPTGGTPLRLYNLIRRAAEEHEVWLAAFTHDAQPEDIAALESICERVIPLPFEARGALSDPAGFVRYLLNGKPAELRLYHSEEIARTLYDLTSSVEFDAVEIVDSFLGLYWEALAPQAQERAILTFIDVIFSKVERISRVEQKKTRQVREWLYSRMMHRWEPTYAARFARCIAMSEDDRALLLAENPGLTVDVVPNGVDVRAYEMTPPAEGPPSLVFVGNMSYRPNVDAALYFCHDILPLVQSAIPEVEIYIVGRNPVPEVRALEGEGVQVTGSVEDVRPYYVQGTASIVPLRAGGGTRLKILEAMALGRPIVSTSVGCEGIAVEDGEHLLIADTAEAFAEQTIRLLRDADLRRHIRERARRLVEERYDWDMIAEKLISVYQAVAR